MGIVLALATAVASPSAASSSPSQEFTSLAAIELPDASSGLHPITQTSDQIGHVIGFRSELGFRTDEEFVRLLAEDPASQDAVEVFGARFSATEWNELGIRWQLQQLWGDLRAWSVKHGFSESLGEMWMDHKSGGRVVITHVGQSAEIERALRDAYPRPERLDFVQVPNSLTTLTGVQDRIFEDRSVLLMAGVDVTSAVVDAQTGRLDVSIRSDTTAARHVLAARYGAEKFDEVKASGLTKDDDGWGTRSGSVEDWNRDKVAYGNPLRGGLILRGYGSSNYQNRCTSGFVANGPSGSVWLTTAAHCYANSENVYQGLEVDRGSGFTFRYDYRKLNPMTRRNRGSFGGINGNGSTQSDIGAVHIPSTLGRNRIYIHPGATYSAITVEQSRSADAVGDVICIAGQFNPGADASQYCGTITTRFASGHDSAGAHFTNLRGATYPRTGGDSGAPIYSAYVARGIHKGVLDGVIVFSHIDRALEDIGLSGVKTS